MENASEGRAASPVLAPGDTQRCPDHWSTELIKQLMLYGGPPHQAWPASPMTMRVPAPQKGALVSGMYWKGSIMIKVTQINISLAIHIKMRDVV